MNYTPKQLNILRILHRYQEEHGFSPTYSEIAKELGVSTITIFEHLQALEKKGAIRRRRHEARSVEVVDRSFLTNRNKPKSFPVRGVFSTGQPLGAVPAGTEISIGDLYTFQGEGFALVVRGSDLGGVNILDGDYLIFEHTTTAKENDLVLASQEGEKSVLRRFVRVDGVEQLEALNPNEPPPEGRAAVQAVLRGVIRRFS